LSSTKTKNSAGLLHPLVAASGRARHINEDELVAQVIQFEIKLAKAQAELGLIDKAHAVSIEHVLQQFKLNSADLVYGTALGGNFAIPLVEAIKAEVAKLDLAAAGQLHLGATSQDLIDTALIQLTKKAIREINVQLDDSIRVLLALANAHKHSLCVARTLAQQAVPSSFGLKLAKWAGALIDVRVELTSLAERLPLQFGGAAGNLASLTLVAESRALEKPQRVVAELVSQLAKDLKLARPATSWHTNRVWPNRIAEALTEITDTFGTIANDILLLGRPEIGELAESVPVGGGKSSAMPQKQNPVQSVLLSAAAIQARGHQFTIKSAASSIDERSIGAWHAEWQSWFDLMKLTLATAETGLNLISGLKFDTDRMLANLWLSDGLVYTERVSAILGKKIANELVDQVRSGANLKQLLESYGEEIIDQVFSVTGQIGLAETLIADISERVKELQ
jgi:3-carboxy-cis,cis-muconate cycloisomerase